MPSFILRKDNVLAIPILHYNMETAALVVETLREYQPDCIAVELPETLEETFLHAASRLPDISVISTDEAYYLIEPCDACYEGLRYGLESGIATHCIDLDITGYPDFLEAFPDPYAISRIGLKSYYEAYRDNTHFLIPHEKDLQREEHMAWKLKELSLRYTSVFFIGGMFHVERVLERLSQTHFQKHTAYKRSNTKLCTLTERSCRDVLGTYPWLSTHYEDLRGEYFNGSLQTLCIDRQESLLHLYKESGTLYEKETGNTFPKYTLRNAMKFARNYALITGYLQPDLFQIISVAKACLDHNYAYEVWVLATEYPFLKNIDNLPQLDLSIKDLWGNSRRVLFHLKEKGRKSQSFYSRCSKQKNKVKFQPPSPFCLCSHQPEDVIVENFGGFLRKKGVQILSEEGAQVMPFSTSLEDGIDLRETIRHWHHDQKLYVKKQRRPPENTGSVVTIFHEDGQTNQEEVVDEKYPWKMTWIGEHDQESDMAFYATPLDRQVVGPGISRCEYGGFMMSFPPRRMSDIWSDPDYSFCQTKAEVLLAAAIDYAIEPLVVFVAEKAPRSLFKRFAQRFGKKILYIPIGQFSPTLLNKLRVFHVLDGHSKRSIADEYIF